jgi:hypothetical protein
MYHSIITPVWASLANAGFHCWIVVAIWISNAAWVSAAEVMVEISLPGGQVASYPVVVPDDFTPQQRQSIIDLTLHYAATSTRILLPDDDVPWIKSLSELGAGLEEKGYQLGLVSDRVQRITNSTALGSVVLSHDQRGLCSVQVGSQRSSVGPLGTISMNNVSSPDEYGVSGPGSSPDFLSDDFLRTIVHCSDGDAVSYAFSEFFQARQGQTYYITNLTFTDTPPRQADRLTITALNSSLQAGGAAHPLQVTATYADGTTADVTLRTAWTSYRVSNPNLAMLSPDGLLTPKAPGTVFVTAMNEAATAVRAITIVDSSDPLMGIVGRVVDASGSVLAGARIVVEPTGALESVSGHDGRFALERVPTKDGPLTLQLSAGEGTNLFVGRLVVRATPGLIADVGSVELRRVPTPPLDGLLSWWSVDLGYRDAVGTNDLSVRGVVSLGDGRVGKGFALGTGGAHLEGPSVGGYAISNLFSVAAWARTSVAGEQTVAGQYDAIGSRVSWWFGFEQGRLALYLHETGVWGNNWRSVRTPGTVQKLGQWQLLSGSVNLSTWELKLFVDGVQVEAPESAATSRRWSTFNGVTSPVRLGAWLNTLGQPAGPWLGDLDEVMIWKRELSATEMEDLYRRSGLEPTILSVQGRVVSASGEPVSGARISASAGRSIAVSDGTGRFLLSQVPFGVGPIHVSATRRSSGVDACATVTVDPAAPGQVAIGDIILALTEIPPMEGLIGWWPANEDLGDRIETNSLNIVGAQRIGSGRIGTGLELDGATGFFSAPWSQSGTLSNQLSFATWVRFQTTSVAQALASQYASAVTTNVGWYLGTAGRKLQLWLYETGWNGPGHLIETRDEVLVDGEWTWLGFSVDTEANRVILMVNGQVVAQAPNTGPLPWNRFNATVTPLFLGGYLGRSNNMLGMLRGNMDEVMLWRRALSVEELAAVAQRGCGTVGVNLGSE